MNQDLYQDQIMAWAKNREYCGALELPHAQARVHNPLCGDRVSVDLHLTEGRIQTIAYEVRGCLLCKAACAHLAAMAVDGHLDLAAVEALHDTLQQGLRDSAALELPPPHEIFTPVRSRKSRHTCILLPYEALIEALAGQ